MDSIYKNELLSSIRHLKPISHHYFGCSTTIVRSIILKKIARIRRAAARPLYEIIKPYGSRIITDQYLDVFSFAAKLHDFLSLQDSRKADLRRS